MGDIIIITAIAIAVFFILRGQIRKFRKGQCTEGCAGCSGSCACCSSSTVSQVKDAGK